MSILAVPAQYKKPINLDLQFQYSDSEMIGLQPNLWRRNFSWQHT